MAPTAEKAPETETGGFDLSREGGDGGWIPEDGDKLVGTITSVGARWSDWTNAFYPMLIIETEEGSTLKGKAIKPGSSVAFHAFHTVPFRRIMQLKPQEGERVGIMFHGTEKNQDGKTSSKVYTVKVQRDAGTGSDPYAGMKAPGGKDAKAEVKLANDAKAEDDLPF